MAKKKIRINTEDTLVIDVNDNGDTLEIYNPLDVAKKLADFAEILTGLKESYDSLMSDVDDTDFTAQFDIVTQLHQRIHDEFENVFGKGACKKVFGHGVDDVNPDIRLIQSFLEQVLPIIADYINADNEKSNIKQFQTSSVNTSPKRYF